jgi:hypothetical protein
LKTEEGKILSIEQELESAQRRLKQTMSVAEAKMSEEVEWVEEVFSPGNLMSDNLIGFSCLAGLLGYLVGYSQYRKMARPLVLVCLGYEFRESLPPSKTIRGSRSDLQDVNPRL